MTKEINHSRPCVNSQEFIFSLSRLRNRWTAETLLSSFCQGSVVYSALLLYIYENCHCWSWTIEETVEGVITNFRMIHIKENPIMFPDHYCTSREFRYGSWIWVKTKENGKVTAPEQGHCLMLIISQLLMLAGGGGGGWSGDETGQCSRRSSAESLTALLVLGGLGSSRWTQRQKVGIRVRNRRQEQKITNTRRLFAD